MGKTLVVISLLLQNPSQSTRMTDAAWKEMERRAARKYPKFIAQNGMTCEIQSVSDRLRCDINGWQWDIPYSGDSTFSRAYHLKQYHDEYGRLNKAALALNASFVKHRNAFHDPIRDKLSAQVGESLRTDAHKVKTTGKYA